MPTDERATRPEGAKQIHLEPARPGDARALAEMSRLVIEQGLAWRWRPAAIAREIHEPDTVVLLAREGKTRIGFAAMRFDFERRRAHLLLLAVAPQWRRQGVARALLGWLEKVARRGGIERVELEVRETAAAARAFYGAVGFQEVCRLPGYYQQREDARRLERRLDRAAPVGGTPRRGPATQPRT